MPSQLITKCLDSLPDVIWITSLDGKELHYLSGGAERFFGRTLAEFQTLGADYPTAYTELIHPEDRVGFASRISGPPGSPVELQYRILRPDRTYRWVHSRTVTVLDDAGNPAYLTGVLRDCTSERQAAENQEQLLKTANHALGTLAHLQEEPLHVCEWTRKVSYNGEWYFFEDFLERAFQIPVLRTASPEIFKLFMEEVPNARAEPPESGTNDHLFLREIFDQTADMIWACSPDRKQLIFVNAAFERIYGRSRTGLLDAGFDYLDTLIEAVHPDDREDYVAQKIQSADLTCDGDFRIVRPDGTVRWIHSRTMPVLDSSNRATCIIGIASDVTDRKLESLALKSQLEVLEAAVPVVRDLRDKMLMVCAWTRRIFYKSEWWELDRFLQEVLKVPVSHGMSPEGFAEFTRPLRQTDPT